MSTTTRPPDHLTISEYERLRDLLLHPETAALDALRDLLTDLQQQVRDPEKRIALMTPVITEILRRSIADSGDAIASVIAPVIDRALLERSRQDKEALLDTLTPLIAESLTRRMQEAGDSIASLLAPVSTRAIALQYREFPAKVAADLAPIIGGAIKEQIRSERDAVVDALYPVIGSTIAKYMSETLSQLVRSINEKIDRNLSFRAVGRKIRAKIRGVSEAELIISESIPVSVEALFLIHKTSGLVIAQVQSSTARVLDADLLSGMLTAIRTFFHDSMNRGDDPSELDQIEYGRSKILLEVAGYCYLAAVIEGEPDLACTTGLRELLSSILSAAGESIRRFNGQRFREAGVVERLMAGFIERKQGRTQHAPEPSFRPIIITAVVIFSLLLLVVGYWMYRHANDRDLEMRATTALTASSTLSPDRLHVEVDGDELTLSGSVPNLHLRSLSEATVRTMTSDIHIRNDVTVSGIAPLPVLSESRFSDMVRILNGIEGVGINARYQNQELTLSGIVPDSLTAQNIEMVFARSPGVTSFHNTMEVMRLSVGTRLYFDPGSAVPREGELDKLAEVIEVQKRHPQFAIRVVGNTDRLGEPVLNQQLSLERAYVVGDALVRAGIPEQALLVARDTDPPGNQPDSLNRCVRFEFTPMPPRPGQ